MVAAFRKISIGDLLWLMLAVELWFGGAADRDRAYKQHEMQTYRRFKELTAELVRLRDENTRFRHREWPD